MITRIFALLLVTGLCQAAERGESPRRERPVPVKQAPRDTKEKHKLAKKKHMHIRMDEIEGRKLVFANSN